MSVLFSPGAPPRVVSAVSIIPSMILFILHPGKVDIFGEIQNHELSYQSCSDVNSPSGSQNPNFITHGTPGSTTIYCVCYMHNRTRTGTT